MLTNGSVHNPLFSSCLCCDGFIDFCECTQRGSRYCKCNRNGEIEVDIEIDNIVDKFLKLSEIVSDPKSNKNASEVVVDCHQLNEKDDLLIEDVSNDESGCICCNGSIKTCLCIEDGMPRCLVCYRDPKALSCGCCKGFYFNCKCIIEDDLNRCICTGGCNEDILTSDCLISGAVSAERSNSFTNSDTSSNSNSNSNNESIDANRLSRDGQLISDNYISFSNNGDISIVNTMSIDSSTCSTVSKSDGRGPSEYSRFDNKFNYLDDECDGKTQKQSTRECISIDPGKAANSLCNLCNQRLLGQNEIEDQSDLYEIDENNSICATPDCICCNGSIKTCLCIEDGMPRCLVCYRDPKALSCGCCKGFYYSCKCLLGEY